MTPSSQASKPGPRRHGCPHRQLGASLIDALAALLVLSMGVVIVARLHGTLRLNADIARQRSEAVRHAQRDVEQARAYVGVSASARGPSYDGIADGNAGADGADGDTRYALERQVSVDPAAPLKSLDVRMSWNDRSGAEQALTLHSLVARESPLLRGVLSTALSRDAWAGLPGEPLQFSPSSRRLDDGRTMLRPDLSTADAWVVDPATGGVTQVCRWNSAATASPWDAGELQDCSQASAQVVSGIVRFADASAADPSLAAAAPLPLSIRLTRTDASLPPAVCATQAVRVVEVERDGVARREWVPVDATPAALGVAGWTELGDRFVAYHCRVPSTSVGSRWSGRIDVVPTGWSIGPQANGRQICRYASDQDGSGRVDANAEHPADYHDVSGPLLQQNFLVIGATATCPTGDASDPSQATVLHAP